MSLNENVNALPPDDRNRALAILQNPGSFGPVAAAAELVDWVGTTSERSIRRWRKRHLTTSVPPEAVMADPNPRTTDDDRVQALRKELLKVMRKLDEEKLRKQDLVAAVYAGAMNAANAVQYVPVKPPVIVSGALEEVAVAVLGDWQLAKVTASYNSDMCESRIADYAQYVIDETNTRRCTRNVTHLEVFILGDIIEGEMIFPGQEWLVDSSLYQQICVDGPRILGNFLRKMLGYFDTVHVTAVEGNHGRIGGASAANSHPDTNGDRMLYTITKGYLAQEDRLTWNIPSGSLESSWYAVARIGEYSSMLLHGNQFGNGLNYNSVINKIHKWSNGAIPEYFHDVDFGHFHTPTRLTIAGQRTARCVGSPESDNGYAQRVVGAMGFPSQGLRFVDPELGIVTAESTIWLELN